MSEALHPPFDSEHESKPTALDTAEQVIHAQPGTDTEGWQTVDFPDALSFDAIAANAHPTQLDNAPMSASDLPSSHAATTPDPALQQENQQLRQQIQQLEQDLGQLQIDLQLERARFFCKQEEAPAPAPVDPTELETLRNQGRQLSNDLTVAQEVNQRQQLLVETLTQQFTNSQERVAQLERDGVSAQQRFNEQLQLTLQAENLCRDLRMRLHRQQRQTLQFKAALEKSLEMNPSRSHDSAPEPADSAPSNDTLGFIPKAHPVKPWSEEPSSVGKPAQVAPASHPHGNPNVTALPNLLHILQPPHAPAPAAQAEANLPSVSLMPGHHTTPITIPAEDLAQLFPEDSAGSKAAATPMAAIHAQEAIFDLAPFVEAGALPEQSGANQPVVHLGRAPENPFGTQNPAMAGNPFTTGSPPVTENPFMASDNLVISEPVATSSEDTLWADLARLIEPEAIASPTAELAPTSDAASSSPETPPEAQPSPRLISLVNFAQQRHAAAQAAQASAHAFAPSTAQPPAEAEAPSAAIEYATADLADITLTAQTQDQPAAEIAPAAAFAPMVASPFITLGDIYAQKPSAEAAHSEATQRPEADLPFASASLDATLEQPSEPPTASLDGLEGGNIFAGMNLDQLLVSPSPEDTLQAAPSPILYPRRSPKKLPSMAAVDLPFFPRTAN
jgi:hypothetical protein